MNLILKKKSLNNTVTLMEVEAPLIAKKCKPGQFIILRVTSDGERIPLTIADKDLNNGSVTIIFQIVGATTSLLNSLNEGDYINDFVGPLGKPTDLDNIDNLCVVGGGVGSAIAYPISKSIFKRGANVTTIVGFRNKDLVILEDEFKEVSNKFILMTDDGSKGEKGLVTNALEKEILNGNKFDKIITIGPLIMMKYVVEVAKKYGIKTIVSMNPIMIDGTGMCGGCRLTVAGKMRFACVDGPDFDGEEIDFDEAISRSKSYLDFEKKKREEACNLLNKEVA